MDHDVPRLLIAKQQIGCLMLRSMVDVNWSYAGDALPAAITLLFIPFSYSVAYGLIA